MRINVWDYGARPQTDCTSAFKAAIDACASAGGGHVDMPYGDPGEYYVQYKGGNGRPAAGYTGVKLKSGVYLHGDESTLITSLPAAMGGLPGQLVGVRIDNAAEQGVTDCGLMGVTLRNDLSSTQNENFHAIMFHNGSGSAAEIRRVTLEGVKILGAAWGDGIYFGSKVSDVEVKRVSVEGAERHGITLASAGQGRFNYLFEDVNLSESRHGNTFHIEVGYDLPALTAALAAGATYEELYVVAGWVRNVTLRRCHFSGNFALNGVADWKIVECTSMPRPSDRTGGGFIVANSPHGTVDRCMLHARPWGAASSFKLITLIGAHADGLSILDSQLSIERCADGTLPTAIHTRQYSNKHPGWPDGVTAVNSTLVTDAGIPIVNAHSGTNWDLSALRHVELPPAFL